MYATTYQLGEIGADDAMFLRYLREVRDLNQSIAANIQRVQPPTVESQRAVAVMMPILRDRLTKLKQAAGVANASELTSFDNAMLAMQRYATAPLTAAKAAGDVAVAAAKATLTAASDLTVGIARTVGEAAGAATMPLILPLLAIGAALWLVGKGGLVGQGASIYKLR